MPTASKPLRILGWPAFRSRQENPYNWLLYSSIRDLGHDVQEFTVWRLLAGKFDVWHFHWPERFLRDPVPAKAWLKSAALLALVWLARLRGTRVVWTAHNLYPHESVDPRLAAWFYARLTGQVDACIHFTDGGMAAALAAHPGLRAAANVVIPHGYYSDMLKGAANRAESRAALGIDPDAPVILFFGQVRPYKDVPALIHAFRGHRDSASLLLVAGLPASQEDADAVREAAGQDPRVRTTLRLLEEAELYRLVAACDLVVLPYKETLNADSLNSGSAILALSAGRPVLVPGLGALPALAATAGTAWVRTYRGELTTPLLADALHWARTAVRPETPNLDDQDWSDIARLTVLAYQGAPDVHPARATNP